MADWVPKVSGRSGPVYRAIVDALGDDIAAGRIAEGERLPPQRQLAAALGIDFTTVTRAYAEAQRQGLVEARVGRGTFVRRRAAPLPSGRIDLAMNLPPRPVDPRLARRLWRSMTELGDERGIDLLMRYQAPGGTAEDRAAGAAFLAPRLPGLDPARVLVAPGAQGALAALMPLVAAPGETVLADTFTYPGFRALAARLGLALAGVPADEEGMDPAALDALAGTTAAKVLYINPTLANPTTATIGTARRAAIVAVARRRGLVIVEDDAYGALPASPPPPFAALAPDLAWHVAGLAKCLSPALRIAYCVAPDERSGERLAGAIRAVATMASPLAAAIATRWIGDGTAAAMLEAIRAETVARHALATSMLPPGLLRADPAAFHGWLTLPPRWRRGEFLARLGGLAIGAVPSEAFALGPAPEALRLGFGVAPDRERFTEGLARIAALLAEEQADEALVV
ncbi:PLP-dependent aminotransferase family protein [Kaistia geumhonensis]|uniref:DNA-binding transcriptional MocR family regulator n=1 Tax=Kaistia geumhonensis TaxID=410839 RepID=A0ABU0M5H9_9HYPH|nr:PLP-dependent aminotransferase family protein [Kaistia geumhonensis]MCX5478561.1 PLP-dependent aminotransferase family protein [Kaistia geumhonensis]MDQ0516221.1 DNA-binding transcriptional MocR family regulator [Kaistia geumhonensis]